jgi:hypothetical protein
MKKLVVFITTHIGETGATRHGKEFRDKLFPEFYKPMIERYIKFDTGLDEQVDIWIFDTGSNSPELTEYVKELLLFDNKKVKFFYRKIKNRCGYLASLIQLMFDEPKLLKEYEYFSIHTDDSMFINGDNWGVELIDYYVDTFNSGIMGTDVYDTLYSEIGQYYDHSYGLHVARIWGLHNNITAGNLIQNIFVLRSINGDWYFLRQKTLKDLGDHWYDCPPEGDADYMKFQKEFENMDNIQLQDKFGQWAKQTTNLGRETELGPRVASFLKESVFEYGGNKIVYRSFRDFYKEGNYWDLSILKPVVDKNAFYINKRG